MQKLRRRAAIIRELADGLVLRRATPGDTEALVRFNGRTLGSPENPDQFVMHWTGDLMAGRHPTFKPHDFTIVEDQQTGEIVSSLCLFSQRWSYAGVEIPIGRPELVATDPRYRRRGLVRAQFDVIHEWSANRGHVLQAITGIPNFYRQFGYEMTLELDADRRGHISGVPKLKELEGEPYWIRPATEADLRFMARVYAQGRRKSLVSSVVSPRLWRYYVFGRTGGEQFCVITTPKGERVGLLAHSSQIPRGDALCSVLYELKPGANWLSVTPSILRYLSEKGADYAAQHSKEAEWLSFRLGTQHPAYEAMPDFLQPADIPYLFYLRVPDLLSFLRVIAPVLEARLAKSIAPGWTGELKLSFFREGIRMAFKGGQLTASEPWSPSQGGESACFRDGTFLHMLFGLHSLEDLRHLNPDCYACNGDAKALVGILFPKQPSSVWAVA